MTFSIKESQKELCCFLKTQKNVPHSQAFIGDYGRGGFLLGLYQAQLLLHGDEEMNLEKLFFHPDLNIIFPEIKNPTSKSEINLALFQTFIKKNYYQNTNDWLLFLNEKKEGLINVETTKRIFASSSLKAFKTNKVYIIWGAETINNTASNKLLKLIEEPPSNTYFIFIVDKESALKQTINSRMQKVYVRPIDSNVILNSLLQKNIDKNRALILSKISNGSVGKSESLVSNQELLVFYENLIIEGLRHSFLASRKSDAWESLITWSEEVAKLSNDKIKGCFNYFILFLRHVFLSHYKEDISLSYFMIYSDFNINKLAPYINNENIIELILLLEKNIYNVERNANKRILCQNLAISIATLLNQKV